MNRYLIYNIVSHDTFAYVAGVLIVFFQIALTRMFWFK